VRWKASECWRRFCLIPRIFHRGRGFHLNWNVSKEM
jgi:hypothetical protein